MGETAAGLRFRMEQTEASTAQFLGRVDDLKARVIRQWRGVLRRGAHLGQLFDKVASRQHGYRKRTLRHGLVAFEVHARRNRLGSFPR